MRSLETEKLQSLILNLQQVKKQTVDVGPQTDDELWVWIKEKLGIEIPRKSVCDGHENPFKFICDVYFERVQNLVVMANREGMKTLGSAIIHLLNSLFKPGCESVSVGAIEAQSLRAYDSLKKLLIKHGDVDVPSNHPMVSNQIQRQTDFRNGSKVEILVGTVSSVNGPHPQKVHADEVELMDPVVFQESRSMSSSKRYFEKGSTEEKVIKAQDWITSTRKRARGQMQALMTEIEDAKKIGAKPPFDTIVWCIYECSRNVDNCQVANPELLETERCECDKIVKSTWDDDSPRRFSEVCKGRLATSEGFLSIGDVHKRFMQCDKDTWEAQHECSQPETGGMVFPMFTRERYGIKWYDPNPENGPIYMGIDWGAGNPHAVSWYQVLLQDTFCFGKDQKGDEEPTKLVKGGARVCFDEIYRAEISPSELADLVIAKEASWTRYHPRFKVERRFADPAGKSARLEWAAHKPIALPTQFFCTRDIKEQIRTCRDILREDLFAVDLIRCPMFVEEAEAYHYPHKKLDIIDDPEKPIDDFNHIMSEFRYTMENLKIIEVGNNKGKLLPKTSKQLHKTANYAKSSAPRYLPREYGV